MPETRRTISHSPSIRCRIVRAGGGFRGLAVLIVAILVLIPAGLIRAQTQTGTATAWPELSQVIPAVQSRMVKIFGAGGLNRLEAYQSGLLVSPDGLILTVWSYVLDADLTTVMLNDGRRMDAKLIGFNPVLEIALLKIDVEEEPFFNLDAADSAQVGTRILSFSNLYGIATGNEQASVQQGLIAAKTTLAARRGVLETAYRGPVLIVDAITNNPGAAGGAITDLQGRFLGMIGRESRNSQTNLWLNYAIPSKQIAPAIENILSGLTAQLTAGATLPSEPLTLELLGLVLVPNVVAKTPPFVDQVVAGSAAATAGLREDDLILEIAGRVTSSRAALEQRLLQIDRDSKISLTVQRGQELISVELRAR